FWTMPSGTDMDLRRLVPAARNEGSVMALAICNATQLVGCPGIRSEATLFVDDDRISWLGPAADTPPLPEDTKVIDAAGEIVLPGFIDSHTHLIFAGSREDEFEQRLQGRTYQEIAASGGGINATVQRVRATSKDELKALARRRLDRLLRFGVTTVEVKSG